MENHGPAADPVAIERLEEPRRKRGKCVSSPRSEAGDGDRGVGGQERWNSFGSVNFLAALGPLALGLA